MAAPEMRMDILGLPQRYCDFSIPSLCALRYNCLLGSPMPAQILQRGSFGTSDRAGRPTKWQIPTGNSQSLTRKVSAGCGNDPDNWAASAPCPGQRTLVEKNPGQTQIILSPPESWRILYPSGIKYPIVR